MRTTKEDFQYFKTCCLDWQNKLSIKNWSLYFEHTKVEGCYAKTAWSTSEMAATVQLATSWDNLRPKTKEELNKLALHEVLHVLLAPLLSEAEYRYTTQDAIYSAEHAIVRSLENIVP